MTTDITELAQREKFEAWVMTQICISKSTLEGLRTADGYRNTTLSGTDYNRMWNCWKASGAELVEALEKAQQQMTESENRVRKQNRHICELFDDNTALRQRIAELEESHAQVIHSRDHYKRMSEEGLKQLVESRTVTVKLPEPYAYLRENDGQIQISIGAERPSDRSGGYATPWFAIYTAAGIKWEAE